MTRIEALIRLLHEHCVPCEPEDVPLGYIAYELHMADEYCRHYIKVPMNYTSKEHVYYSIYDQTGLLCTNALTQLNDVSASCIDTAILELILNSLFESGSNPVCPVPLFNRHGHYLD